MTAFTTTGGTSHSSAISGLSPASYSYYVKCSDAQSNTNAADYTISFSVAADTTPPVISAISSGTPGQAGTTITWTTDENADSQVVYGLTASYGSQTTLDPILGTAHGVALTGLAASTAYHFAAVSKDASGNTATSSDQTFTTAANDTAAIAEHNKIVSGGGGIISGPLSIGFHVAIPDTTASSSSTGVSGTVVGRAATSAGPGLVNPGSSSIYLQQNRQLYDRGEDIRSLQKFLNLQGFIVAQRGPGSMGNETSIFGTHTYRAVVQFQSAHGLPATGFLGPLTRGTINGQ